MIPCLWGICHRNQHYGLCHGTEISDRPSPSHSHCGKDGAAFCSGDTCYSWSEDTAVYNPDGKEIIARDNEVSILRKEDISKAYLGCHTDITIPYDELGSIRVQTLHGDWVSLLRTAGLYFPEQKH